MHLTCLLAFLWPLAYKFNAESFQTNETNSVLWQLLVSVQSATDMVLWRTASHLFSSIHGYLKKIFFWNFKHFWQFWSVCMSQFCVSTSPKVVLPKGPMRSSSLLVLARTTQTPTVNTGSVQSCCCDDSFLLRCDVLSLRMRFPTFRMKELQLLFEPWRSRITFLGNVENYRTRNNIPEHLDPQQYRYENLILLRYKK
jgi:hypothetical protein